MEHNRATIEYAYRLVKEYDDHQREQDKLWREKNDKEETLESPDRA